MVQHRAQMGVVTVAQVLQFELAVVQQLGKIRQMFGLCLVANVGGTARFDIGVAPKCTFEAGI